MSYTYPQFATLLKNAGVPVVQSEFNVDQLKTFSNSLVTNLNGSVVVDTEYGEVQLDYYICTAPLGRGKITDVVISYNVSAMPFDADYQGQDIFDDPWLNIGRRMSHSGVNIGTYAATKVIKEVVDSIRRYHTEKTELMDAIVGSQTTV